MPKSSTNLSIDSNLKRASIELFSDLGLPFAVTRVNPNAETAAAMNEYYEMKAHPEKYKKYPSFKDAMSEALEDA